MRESEIKPKLLVNEFDGLCRSLILPVETLLDICIHQCIKIISLLLGHQSGDGEGHQRGLLLNGGDGELGAVDVGQSRPEMAILEIIFV